MGKTCSVGDCCFLPMSDKNGCFSQKKLWCEEYIPCTKIDKYNGKSKDSNNDSSSKNKNDKEIEEVDDIISLVKQACYISPVKASTTDYSKCANLCQSRMCCFQTDDNLSCYNDKTDWCEEFSACYKLNIGDLIGNSKPTSSSTAISTIPVNDETELKVDEACSEKSIETLSGMASCGKLCADKKCCFDSSISNDNSALTSSTSLTTSIKKNDEGTTKCVI